MTDPTALPNLSPQPSGGLSQQNGADLPEATPARDRFVAALRELGLDSSVDGDGDLEFKVDDQTLFARVAEGDNPIGRVFGQWQLGEPVSNDPLERLQRTNDFTMQLNLIRICIVNDSLVASGDIVALPSTDLTKMMELTINHLLGSVRLFFQSWLPEPGQAEGFEGADGPAPSDNAGE